jgi:hypothetical protein
MKKVIALFFAVGFAAVVVSCGQKTENNETAADSTVMSEPAPVVGDTSVTDSATVEPIDSANVD